MLNRVLQAIFIYKNEVLIGLFLFIVSTTSFGLGYLTFREFNRVPIVIEKCSA
jgi:hypothetical protein